MIRGERGIPRPAAAHRHPWEPIIRTTTRTPLEDLDAIAERYAGAWTGSAGPRRDRLREEMIRAALPMAGRLARRYRNRGEPVEDLEQVARLGLVKAVDRYAPARGSFTAYAITTITGELKRHFRDHTWGVHVPRRLQDLGREITEADAVLRHDTGRAPTDAELAGRCGVDVEQVAAARLSAAGYRSASLNTPMGDDGAEMGSLFGESDPEVGMVEDRLTVRHLIARMPDRERRMLTLRFYGNLGQAEIAAQFGVSQMHVSRLLTRALGWLREAMLTDTTPRWPAEEPDTRLTIRTTPAPAATIVHVAGEVDRDNAAELTDALLAAVRRAGGAVVLDLAAVPFLDAAGVRVLVAVHEAARVRGVTVTVTGLRPHVREVVAISGLRALLEPRTP